MPSSDYNSITPTSPKQTRVSFNSLRLNFDDPGSKSVILVYQSMRFSNVDLSILTKLIRKPEARRT
jgi:hypothetical protein